MAAKARKPETVLPDPAVLQCLGPEVAAYCVDELLPEHPLAAQVADALATHGPVPPTGLQRMEAALAARMVKYGHADLPTCADVDELGRRFGVVGLTVDELAATIEAARTLLEPCSGSELLVPVQLDRSSHVADLSADILYVVPHDSPVVELTAVQRAELGCLFKDGGPKFRRDVWRGLRITHNSPDSVCEALRVRFAQMALETSEGAAAAATSSLDAFIGGMFRDQVKMIKALCDIAVVKGARGPRVDLVIDQLQFIRKKSRQGLVWEAGRIARDLVISLAAGHSWGGGDAALPDAPAKRHAVPSPAGCATVVLCAVADTDDPHLPTASEVHEAFRRIVGRAPRQDEKKQLAAVRELIGSAMGWPRPDGSGPEREVAEIIAAMPDDRVTLLSTQVPVPGCPTRRFDMAVQLEGGGGPSTVIIEVDGAQHSQRCLQFQPTAAAFRNGQAADVLKQEAWTAARGPGDGGIVVVDHSALSSKARGEELRCWLPELLEWAATEADIVVVAAQGAEGRALSRSWEYEPHPLGEHLGVCFGSAPSTRDRAA